MRSEYKEIRKLAKMLIQEHIPFRIDYLSNGMQVAYYDTNDSTFRVCSAVEHDGSYGHAVDRIEIMGLVNESKVFKDSVEGYLTAKEVFERIKEYHYATNHV
jgi:hypothetical protein